uniref:GST C-terminal domain-containing protein n=1 Tax=Pan troglodytes TaxID=9598 RepID=A0A2I3TKZ5_PANTR
MPMTLGYWDIRGPRAISPSWPTPSACLLEYTDSSYVEKKYTLGDVMAPSSPDYDRSQWLPRFPSVQLPYLIDGVHKITRANHNLCECWTEEEKIRVDILENQTTDNWMQLVMICYHPEFEKLKPKYLEELPEKLKLYSEFLEKQPWFAGDKITFVDFLAYDVLDMKRIFEPKCLDAFLNLKDFISRFEGLKISAYMKSSQFFRGLLFGKSATWNSK